MNENLKQWKYEENIARIYGWDFSHIDDKYLEEELSWNYKNIINKYLKPNDILLDIDTGGGFVLWCD